MPLLVVICHPKPGTCYDQPIYKIWNLYLHRWWR